MRQGAGGTTRLRERRHGERIGFLSVGFQAIGAGEATVDS